VRPASELERRRLGETFAELCAIPSPTFHERAVADRVAAELRALGLEVVEDGAGAELGGDAGNLLARIPGRGERTILLCAHLDTVGAGEPVEPVLVDGRWENAREGILGADNKAAVAMLLEVARRVSVEGSPVGLELLFTVAEEQGLLGARALDVGALHSTWGYVFDHATPIGEIVMAAPTFFRFEATFHGQSAHAGIRPEAGRSAIVAAARAVTSMRLGRLDEATTANVARIEGGGPGTNVVPDRCRIVGECRSLDDATADATMRELVDRIHDAANDPTCAADVDVVVEQQMRAYRHRPSAPGVRAAEVALEASGYVPTPIVTGGGADAHVFEAAGLHCVCLANGTERNHQPDERVSVAALEGMLDVTFALLDACAEA
jgi:tripeptide aminopeptidase